MEPRDEVIYWTAVMLRSFASIADDGVTIDITETREHCIAEDIFEWLPVVDPMRFAPDILPEDVKPTLERWLAIDAGDDTGSSFGVRNNGLLLLSAYLGHNLGRFVQGTR